MDTTGSKGLQRLCRLIATEQQPIVGWGGRYNIADYVSKAAFSQYKSVRTLYGIRARLLYEDLSNVADSKLTEFRRLPQPSDGSTTLVFGKYIVRVAYDDTAHFKVTLDRQKADAFRRQFEAMWSAAE